MPPELARIIQEDYEIKQEEWDAAPPASDIADDDINDMSIEDIEGELHRLIFGLPVG